MNQNMNQINIKQIEENKDKNAWQTIYHPFLLLFLQFSIFVKALVSSLWKKNQFFYEGIWGLREQALHTFFLW